MKNRNDFAEEADALAAAFKNEDPMRFRERLADELFGAYTTGLKHEYLGGSKVSDLKNELARVHMRESEAIMQAERDAKRADANATQVSSLLAAVEVARTKGEHYPVCGMPPREVTGLGDGNDVERGRAWREAKVDACSTPEGKKAWWAQHCTCWKGEMEAKLQSLPVAESAGPSLRSELLRLLDELQALTSCRCDDDMTASGHSHNCPWDSPLGTLLDLAAAEGDE